MSAKIFKEFKLLFRLICFDCGFVEDFSTEMGKVFNLEGDVILGARDEMNYYNISCGGCSNFMHFELKEIVSVSEKRELYNWIKNIKD